jgi:molybdopterin-guanine dinucleotide biosynthesis protein A
MTGSRAVAQARTGSSREDHEQQTSAAPRVSAVVLAGGKSRRLGVDKALLKLDGELLLARILRTLAKLSDDLLVVADDRAKLAHLEAPVVPDVLPGRGALGGIYSGLQSMRYPRGLLVACDMPMLNPELLRYMILLSSSFDVVIPRIGDNVEPLHAVYSKACAGPIAEILQRGDARIVDFFPRVHVRYVEQGEIEAFDPQLLSFFNINEPEDLEKAREFLKHQAN